MTGFLVLQNYFFFYRTITGIFFIAKHGYRNIQYACVVLILSPKFKQVCVILVQRFIRSPHESRTLIQGKNERFSARVGINELPSSLMSGTQPLLVHTPPVTSLPPRLPEARPSSLSLHVHLTDFLCTRSLPFPTRTEPLLYVCLVIHTQGETLISSGCHCCQRQDFHILPPKNSLVTLK